MPSIQTSHRVRDAQGNSISVAGETVLTLDLLGPAGEVVEVKERFLLGPVQQPILCLGKFTQQGWALGPSPSSGIALSKDAASIDVQLKHNSLKALAYVRVGANDIVVEPSPELSRITHREGWHAIQTEDFWIPAHYQKDGVRFQTGMPTYIPEQWPYRTTVLRVDGKWILVECNMFYLDEVMPYGTHGRKGCNMISILHQHELPWNLFFRDPTSCPERFSFFNRSKRARVEPEPMAFEEEPHVQSSEQESPIADAPEIEQSEHVRADVSAQAKPDIEAVPHELSGVQDPPSKNSCGWCRAYSRQYLEAVA